MNSVLFKKIINKKSIFLGILIYSLLHFFNFLDFSLLINSDKKMLTSYLLFIFIFIHLFYIIASYRWHLILKALKRNVSSATLMHINIFSSLAAYLMPGSLGSEVAKIYLLRKTLNFKNNISSILIDRIIGLITHFFIFFLIYFVLFYNKINYVSLAIGFLILIGLGIIFVNFFPKNKIYFKGGVFKKIINVLAYIFNFFIKNKKLSFLIFCLSIAQIYIYAFSLNLLIRALGIDTNFNSITFGLVASNLLAILPITPGNLGISEYAFQFSLSTISYGSNFNAFASVYMIFRFINIIYSAIYCFVYRKKL
jgi:uncharacterized protein (TIRG00374 family)